MNKADLINVLAQKTGISKKDILKVIDNLVATLTDEINKTDKFSLHGLGTFSITSRKARIGRNPRTGEEITIPESRTVKFKPTKTLKEAIQH